MAIKEVSRKAASLFFRRYSIEGEHGYPKRAEKYYFITKNTVPRGYIGVERQQGGLKIKSIFVRPEDRRKSYGSRMIRYVSHYGVRVFAESYPETEPFFNANGLRLDMFGKCGNPLCSMLTA